MHNRHGTVDWEVVRRLFYGSMPAAVLTLIWLHFSGISGYHDSNMMALLGAVLILSAVATLFKKQFHALGNTLRDRAPTQFKRLQPGLTVLAGAILGFLVTFTSVGAGALGAVMLLYLYPKRMKPSILIGTDIIHAVPLTFIAGIGHLLLGNVNYVLMMTLLAGSIPGVLLGATVSTKAPDAFLRIAIATALTFAGVKMLA